MKTLLYVGSVLVLAGLCAAEDRTWMRARRFEIGINGGNTLGNAVGTRVGLAIFGNSRIDAAGAIAVGVSAGTFVTSTLIFYGQVTAIDGRSEYHDLGFGYTSETNLANVIYEGGFQRMLPVRANRRLVPYVLGSGATIQIRGDILVNLHTDYPEPEPDKAIEGATRARLNKAVFAPAVGGGVRFSVSDRIGLKLELRTYFPVAELKTSRVVGFCGIVFYFR
jgi:hypothetical protein